MSGFPGLALKTDWNKASDRDWVSVLAGLPLFEGVGKRGLRRIVREAEFAEFNPDDTVVAVGAPPNFFYVILSGEARAWARPAAHVLTTGDYFGEMGLLDGAPRSATVAALGELHVMRIGRRAFDDAIDRNPVLARRFLTELGGRVRQLERQAARRTA